MLHPYGTGSISEIGAFPVVPWKLCKALKVLEKKWGPCSTWSDELMHDVESLIDDLQQGVDDGEEMLHVTQCCVLGKSTGKRLKRYVL